MKAFQFKFPFLLIIFLAIIAFSLSCKKNTHPVPNANVMPPSFDFTLMTADGDPLLNESDKLKLSYVSNGEIQFVEDLKIKQFLQAGKTVYYATTVFAPLRSSENISKTFYLQVNEEKIDTILLDVVKFSGPIEGEYNRYDAVKFNGQEIVLDRGYEPALWIFKR